MDSESARMSSAAEARYRIDYPNSKPRVVKVVALDAASERVVKRVAERQWQRATFFTSIKFDGVGEAGWDSYIVQHTNGRMQTRIILTKEGKVAGLMTTQLP